MNRIIAVTLLLVAILTGPAIAEIYKYVDETGNLRFTDDITQIPADQRKKMDTYKEIVTDPDAVKAAQQERAAAYEQLQQDQEAANDAAQAADLEARAAKLKKTQAALKHEAEKLAKEREALGPQPSNAASASRLRVYNKNVDDYNQKLRAHQAKTQSLENELKTLNEDAGRAAVQLDLE